MGWPITHESVIYCIRCKENGKVYIGRTYDLNRRIKEHFSELRRGMKRGHAAGRRAASGWQKDFNEFGEKAFDVYLLEENISPEYCQAREHYWIMHYNSADPKFGYNYLDESIKRPFPAAKAGIPPRLPGAKEDENA